MTRRETQAKHEMIRSLVLLYGPREAARQLGISSGTVTELAARKGWRQATAAPSCATGSATSARSTASAADPSGQSPQNPNPSNPIQSPVSPSDAIAVALSSHKQRSTAALGQFVAEASEEALQGKDRLGKAKRVRDVAAIHTSLWPAESRPALLAVGILIGSVPVPDSAGSIPGPIDPRGVDQAPELLADVELGADPAGPERSEDR
jgi:hypothetical protein